MNLMRQALGEQPERNRLHGSVVGDAQPGYEQDHSHGQQQPLYYSPD